MMQSRIHDFFVRRRRHSLVPTRIAQFDAVPARIEDEELPAGEKAAGTVIDRFVNLDAELMKQLASNIEHLRTHVEGVVQAPILLHGPDDGIVALTEKNIVVAELE